jgi:hypothetical protein
MALIPHKARKWLVKVEQRPTRYPIYPNRWPDGCNTHTEITRNRETEREEEEEEVQVLVRRLAGNDTGDCTNKTTPDTHTELNTLDSQSPIKPGRSEPSRRSPTAKQILASAEARRQGASAPPVGNRSQPGPGAIC